MELKTDTFLHLCATPASSLAAAHALDPHTHQLSFGAKNAKIFQPEALLHVLLLPEVHLSALFKPSISKNHLKCHPLT